MKLKILEKVKVYDYDVINIGEKTCIKMEIFDFV